jgi:hypothetical protein
MRIYHFSFGDSTRGVVGLCARVRAKTHRRALAVLRRALEEGVGPFGEIGVRTGQAGIEYINVYVCPDNIGRLKSLQRGGRSPSDE